MTGRLAGLLLLLLSGAATALDRVQLDWGDIEADGWRAEGVSLVLGWDAAGQSRLTLSVARAEIGAYRFEQVRLVCDAFDLLTERVACRQGRLSLSGDLLTADAVPATLEDGFASRQSVPTQTAH